MEDPRCRAVIQRVAPEIDAGRFPAKRVRGETVEVTADIYTDGHDALAAVVRHREAGSDRWRDSPMVALANDRWRGTFAVHELGRHEYTVQAWVDHFGTWRRDLSKQVAADLDVSVELLAGAQLVEDAASHAPSKVATELKAAATALRNTTMPDEARVEVALDDMLAGLVAAHDQRRFATTYDRVLEVEVEHPRAAFSSWYELFPRSFAAEPGEHGTLRDVERLLPYVAGMGFDVLYLPPIHPIGETARKGRNNHPTAEPDDVGSPWAIGSADGGHTAVHPQLGTVDDVARLIERARGHGLELALDIAFQCSPDHPYVSDHPEWFRTRPDGTIQYAENPPKKYQDIYPFDFECDAWESLWEELADVIRFWVDVGVQVFRVDNPHTKSLRFWEWCIGEIRRDTPEVVFLSEAFTRPAVMYDLAKRGFSQSYTYFTWRNRAWELEEYFSELTQTGAADYFRPNAWPNTPDILPEFLQFSGRAGFIVRLVLAATLSANYGIYGPAFELMENIPREPGGEEYLDSEKYQLRRWDLDRPDSLRDLITRVNSIRRDHTALHTDRTLRFHHVDNPELLCYSKTSLDGSEAVLVVANLDPRWTQAGWTALDLDALGLEPDQGFQVHDLLGDGRYLWHGAHNFVELDPQVLPAHVFRLRRRERSEHDFDYFL